MATQQLLLFILFAVHWIAFVALLIKQRRPSLLLPIAVFTLLMLTQVYWTSEVILDLPLAGTVPLPRFLRVSAIVLAVPSIGLMVRRVIARIQERKTQALTPSSEDR